MPVARMPDPSDFPVTGLGGQSPWVTNLVPDPSSNALCHVRRDALAPSSFLFVARGRPVSQLRPVSTPGSTSHRRFMNVIVQACALTGHTGGGLRHPAHNTGSAGGAFRVAPKIQGFTSWANGHG